MAQRSMWSVSVQLLAQEQQGVVLVVQGSARQRVIHIKAIHNNMKQHSLVLETMLILIDPYCRNRSVKTNKLRSLLPLTKQSDITYRVFT